MYRLPFYSIILTAFIFSGCNETPKDTKTPPPTKVSVQTLTPQKAPAIIEVSGQTSAFQSVQIYARTTGFLQKKHFLEGSYVTQGKTLFTLDPTDLMHSLAMAKGSYEQAKADYENASTTKERLENLYKSNATTKQELDNAIATFKRTKAMLMSAEASLQQAKQNLSYTEIKAPISGFIDKIKVDVGTLITPSQNGWLTTLYQSDKLYVTFNLSESTRLAIQKAINLGELKNNHNQKVTLMLSDGTKVEKTATIDFNAPSFDTTTGTLSYRAILDNSDHKMLPGQFVRINFTIGTWDNAIILPQKAVLTNAKGHFAYIAEKNNTASVRLIQASSWVDDNVVITSGLKTGDNVIVDGVAKLRPGGAIAPHVTK